ncbi:50S ribosome-binding GTPase [Candidatus Dojkabacteria bacterium]|uniref:50S ribosome-binding GTPase n=1 Tax=Candidatus Dojkabacteria bacterium TaxID=2099670 RepID=A0A955LAL3_9BACT|nr:50S ribosome-binding GTPase [Candidatus Dojkabacteria bacterium]
MKFKDSIRLECKAGDGGDGIASMGPFRKSDGGDGGVGGNFYLRGSRSRYDLGHIRQDNIYKAENGERGGKNQLTGAGGDHYYLDVPLATVVYNDLGEKVTEVTEDEEIVLLLKGGRGGRGNYSFRGSKEYGNWEKWTPGEKMPVTQFKFELELQSDFIFIGYPNAGKSTILNELTNANAKVAPYEFTTIDPQKGRLDDITLLDLPGLIEGTFEGKGLGTGFVKHTKRSKFVAHFVSFENEDMIGKYKSMRAELKNIDEELINKPEIIILSKSDEVSENIEKDMIKKFEKETNRDVVSVSIIKEDSIQKLKKLLKSTSK